MPDENMKNSLKTTHLFNPDNDLALGNGDANYLPPQSARQMAHDLAILPMWFAQPGDAVVIPHSEALYYWSKTLIKQLNTTDIEWITSMDKMPDQPISPWGWNPALIKQLTQRGVAGQWLPDARQMALWRDLSHRRTASEMLTCLMARLEETGKFVGKSYVCPDEESIRDVLAEYPQTFLKAPWSGSGKGLRRGNPAYLPPLDGWCRRLLKQQGAVIIEPLYTKVKDFAMEFYSQGDGSPLTFAGYSYFATDDNGAYKGNLLMSDKAIEDILSAYVGKQALHLLRDTLTDLMSRKFAPVYRGYIGVDMMICLVSDEEERQTPRYAVHPCVEINMRMNMGVVSHQLFERYVTPEAQGRFFVEYYPSNAALKEMHKHRMADHPLMLGEEGRIIAGYHPLTPIGRQTQYLAGMIIG